jgi:hypothetical protein
MAAHQLSPKVHLLVLHLGIVSPDTLFDPIGILYQCCFYQCSLYQCCHYQCCHYQCSLNFCNLSLLVTELFTKSNHKQHNFAKFKLPTHIYPTTKSIWNISQEEKSKLTICSFVHLTANCLNNSGHKNEIYQRRLI